MAVRNSRKHNTFVAKADRLTKNVEALVKLTDAVRRLTTQVSGTVAVLSTLATTCATLVCFVAHAIARFGTTIG